MPDIQSEPTTRVLCTCSHRRTNHRGPVGPNGERGECMAGRDEKRCGCRVFVLKTAEESHG